MLFDWRIRPFVITIILGFPTIASAAPTVEVEESRQNRDRYEVFAATAGINPLRPAKPLIRRLSRQPLNDKISIFSVPLILSQDEYAEMRAGARQRARALIDFFVETVFGDARFWQTLPGAVRSAILQGIEFDNLDQLRTLWRNKTKKDVHFFYGPDLIRGPLLYEDNIGPLGGLADNAAIHQAYLENLQRQYPELAVQISTTLSERYQKVDSFGEILRFFLSAIHITESPKAIYVRDTTEPITEISENARRQNDLEFLRKEHEASSLGLRIEPPTVFETGVPEAQAFIQFHVADQEAYRQLFASSPAAFLNGPGTEMLGNKLLLPYVDHMIETYLHEKPILRIPPTEIFTIEILPQAPWYRLVPLHPEAKIPGAAELANYVYKAVFADGGDGVQVLGRDRNGPDRIFTFMALEGFDQDPFILQEFAAASTLRGYKVDVRPLVLIAAGEVAYVSPTPWGRASKLRFGISNVSAGGNEAVVLVEKCVESLTRLPVR
jgi:hypothetical protein